MAGFLRNIVALSGIWALCELLLPEGGVQKMARLFISLLVMTVLVASLADALSELGGKSLPSLAGALGDVARESASAPLAAEAGYTQAYLRSQANQAEDACVRIAKNAGYVARAKVYLQAGGALERIELLVEGPLRQDSPPLIDPEQLRQTITKAFQAEDARVRLDGDETR